MSDEKRLITYSQSEVASYITNFTNALIQSSYENNEQWKLYKKTALKVKVSLSSVARRGGDFMEIKGVPELYELAEQVTDDNLSNAMLMVLNELSNIYDQFLIEFKGERVKTIESNAVIATAKSTTTQSLQETKRQVNYGVGQLLYVGVATTMGAGSAYVGREVGANVLVGPLQTATNWLMTGSPGIISSALGGVTGYFTRSSEATNNLAAGAIFLLITLVFLTIFRVRKIGLTGAQFNFRKGRRRRKTPKRRKSVIKRRSPRRRKSVRKRRSPKRIKSVRKRRSPKRRKSKPQRKKSR